MAIKGELEENGEHLWHFVSSFGDFGSIFPEGCGILKNMRRFCGGAGGPVGLGSVLLAREFSIM